MTRKIKSLGLAFVAVAAMSMVVAGGAQAAQLHASTAGANAYLSGTQTTQHAFTVDTGIVKCTSATFIGSAAKTAQDGEVTAQYTGCNVSGIAALVDMNGCKYTITGTGQEALKVKVDITGCTSGKVISVTAGSCTVTVPEQTGLGTITLANTATDVNGTINIAGITYQTHGTCPNTASDHTTQTTNGTYTGGVTFQANELGIPANVTHNGHQALNQPTANGAAVTLQAT
jgi:hypothetical protein